MSCTSAIPSGAQLALVTLIGSADLVVRDITDISKPVTRCTFKTCIQYCSSFGPQSIGFISRTQVSYMVNSAGGNALYVADLGTKRMTLVLRFPEDSAPMSYAWAPDGSALVYVITSAAGTETELHRLKGGQDQILATMPAVPAVGCEAQCVGEDTWDYGLTYSPDGNYISLTDSIVEPVFRIWTADGKQLNPPDSEIRAWSVWTGGQQYVAGAGGVQVWRGGSSTLFLPGVSWMRPSASGAGQIIYEVRDASGWMHVYTVDTVTTKIVELKKARINPTYLTPRYVWYGGERACVAADHCAAFPTVATGTTYVYDLLTTTETQSVITGVADVWPHSA